MNENMLVSLDDAALEDVNGGLSFGLSVNDTTLLGASLDLSHGIQGSLTVLGHTVSAGLSLSLNIG
jgi:hypothetical protein